MTQAFANAKQPESRWLATVITLPAIAFYAGALAFMSGWSGIDFGQYAPTDFVKKVETNAIVSVVEISPAAPSPRLSGDTPLTRWAEFG